MKTRVRQTSIDAYHSLKNLSQKQKKVYKAMREWNGPLTNKEIGDLLKWEINRVTGRVNELRKAHLVREYDKVYDPKTRASNTRWIAVEKGKDGQLSMF